MGNSSSAAEFRGLVQALIEDDLPVESELWNKFWELPTGENDVFTMIAPEEVRSLLANSPQKIQILLLKGTKQFDAALEEETLDHETKRNCMNAVRILTRMLPFVLERETDPFVESMLWDPAAYNDEICLAHAWIEKIGRLLFLPGLCVSSSIPRSVFTHVGRLEAGHRRFSESPANEDEDTDHDEGSLNLLQTVNRSLLWLPGIGTLGTNKEDRKDHAGQQQNPTPDPSYNDNRGEILRLLLVCQSGILFLPSSECKPENNRWIKAVSLILDPDDGGIPFARELFCSLLNQVCNYDPVGWGVPYASTLRSGTREERFTDICLHSLLVLLEVNSWSNVFRRMVSEIQSQSEFQFLSSNLIRLLKNVPDSENTMLPNSVKQLQSSQELLVLLWKVLDGNKEFMYFVLNNCDVNEIVLPVCFFLWNGRQNVSQVGLIHICTFVILLLSGERSFGVGLNKPFNPSSIFLRGGPKMSHCNHGDLLVIVFYKLIINGSRRLNTLYNCFLTILSNISPYIKNFGQIASMQILSLFEKFSSRKFLFAVENNHQYLFFLLDIFNNVVQYQYEGNAQLIYTLCVQEKFIRRLVALEFEELDAVSVSEDSNHRSNVDQNSGEHSQRPKPHFVPTKEWFDAWKAKLPLSTVIRVLDILVPKVQVMCQKEDGSSRREEEILSFLRNFTLVGLLPVPHPIVIRRYQPNQYTTLWFTTYTWGVIFLRNQELPIWDSNSIKLFTISLTRS